MGMVKDGEISRLVTNTPGARVTDGSRAIRSHVKLYVTYSHLSDQISTGLMAAQHLFGKMKWANDQN